MIRLPDKWARYLASMPETGMGYQVISVTLNDGTRLNQVVVVDGLITQVRGHEEIPFTPDQIAEIVVTHDKWDFKSEK